MLFVRAGTARTVSMYVLYARIFYTCDIDWSCTAVMVLRTAARRTLSAASDRAKRVTAFTRGERVSIFLPSQLISVQRWRMQQTRFEYFRVSTSLVEWKKLLARIAFEIRTPKRTPVLQSCSARSTRLFWHTAHDIPTQISLIITVVVFIPLVFVTADSMCNSRGQWRIGNTGPLDWPTLYRNGKITPVRVFSFVNYFILFLFLFCTNVRN